MRLVVLDSPLRADTEAARLQNLAYGRACLRDSVLRGEAPLAPHLLYTQPGIFEAGEEARRHGIEAGLAWRTVAEAIAVYLDRGLTPGMIRGVAAALSAGIPVEARRLDGGSTDALLREALERASGTAAPFAPRRRVILESPFAGPDPAAVEANVAYARRALGDSLSRGEAPIASHLLLTQDGVLDDTVPAERELGINAGLAWRRVAEGSVVYIDRGVSRGMKYGVEAARKAGLAVDTRSLGKEFTPSRQGASGDADRLLVPQPA